LISHVRKFAELAGNARYIQGIARSLYQIDQE